MNDISDEKVNKKRTEVRGTRSEDLGTKKNLDPSSFILDPEASSLEPRSSVLRLVALTRDKPLPRRVGERAIKEER